MRLVAFEWNKRAEGRTPVSVPCLACGRMIGERDDGVADLDGPAYHAYYHVACAPSESGLC